ncbi:hypothetical protein K443DRAFT_100553 [Laccaria amethystina LaAM-08-1]|uniref:Unplaced genomic scaffold K443scaffold_93, whole genome shotgun sequence n=1 Tax=Laccaria amethystina LaAM-08-1 TaxID=1095629 RepID=A0A0C9XWK1_9AGAR|nr:hypothetical protein K443DRAFT_100553 [Laccaria amethystina LaAM-08-1]
MYRAPNIAEYTPYYKNQRVYWKETIIEPSNKAMVPCLEPNLKRIKNQKLGTLCTIN